MGGLFCVCCIFSPSPTPTPMGFAVGFPWPTESLVQNQTPVAELNYHSYIGNIAGLATELLGDLRGTVCKDLLVHHLYLSQP